LDLEIGVDVPVIVFLFYVALFGLGLYLIAIAACVVLSIYLMNWLFKNLDAKAVGVIAVLGSVTVAGLMVLGVTIEIVDFTINNPAIITTGLQWSFIAVGVVSVLWPVVLAITSLANWLDEWQEKWLEYRSVLNVVKRIEQGAYDRLKTAAINSKARLITHAKRLLGEKQLNPKVTQAINDAVVENLVSNVHVTSMEFGTRYLEAKKVYRNKNLNIQQQRRLYAECMRQN
jgi:signal transduction histidine kinase